MTEQLRQIITVALAVIAAPIVGMLLAGLDRKVTARVQGRIGPPVLQPFYDIFKLLGKEAIAVNRIQIVYVYLHLAFMVLVVVLLALGQDMLMILFAHTFSTIALILGGMSVRSPYSRIGSHRKILQMLAYEPVLVLMVIGIYLVNHNNFQAGAVLSSGKPLLLTLPLIFLTFLMAAAIKLEKSPFDVASSHHAHQELVKGVTIEYAGPYLAMVELAHFIEVFIIFWLISMFWVGGSLAASLPIGIGIAALAFFGMILLDNVFARLTSMWMVRYMWTVPMTLALSNVIWLFVAAS